jgi:glycosyltransferase involved in cell wall biosynthesis
VRTLLVSDEVPWPLTSGYRIRLRNVLQALARLGAVDLWSVLLDDRPPDAVAPPTDTPARRVEVRVHAARRSGAARLARWVLGHRPRELGWHDERDLRRALETFARPPYDLVWYSGLSTFVRFEGIVDAPTIVDFDNLVDVMLEHRRAIPVGSTREQAARCADRIDRRRWARLQTSVAGRVGAVVVCSELDRERLRASNGAVVPNAYAAPEPPVPRLRPRDGDGTLLFVGLLTYPPNADAVRFLANEILPTVRRSLPDVRARVIGRHDGALADLHDTPGLEIVGPVDDLDAELRAADVAVVPVRSGGGTRVKILEAFAYRLPVVATPIGCEGLDVVAGRDLLVAADGEAFASACVELLTDATRQAAITDAGYARWHADYRPEVVEAAVTELAARVTARAHRP